MTTNQTMQNRPEDDADARRALELDGEQRGQKPDGDRYDASARRPASRLAGLPPPESTLIAGVIMPSPNSSPAPSISAHNNSRRAALLVFMQQAVEREHAALAVVLRAQHQDRVFDRDDDGDRPDHQRDAPSTSAGVCATPAAEKNLVHRVERRRADIAVNDAQRADGQRREAAARARGPPTCASTARVIRRTLGSSTSLAHPPELALSSANLDRDDQIRFQPAPQARRRAPAVSGKTRSPKARCGA